MARADRDDRRTPRWFFDQCVARFGPFDVDVAASPDNALCRVHFTSRDDALALDWNWLSCWCNPPYGPGGTIPKWIAKAWCNPPYGPGGTIPKWIAKARKERDRWGTRTLLLLPADTSTKWYQDVIRTELTETVPFRLAFEAPDGSTKGNSAKFGSVLVWIAPKLTPPPRKTRRPRSTLSAAVHQGGC